MSPPATRVLFDAPGPRGRRLIRLVTGLSLALAAVVVTLVVARFAASGQLGRSRWTPFLRPEFLAFLGEGLIGTLTATALAAALSFPAGLALALGRLSRHGVVRRASAGYVELFRSVPLLLLVYAFLLALPPLGIDLPLLWKLVVPITLVNAALVAEIYRAGITAIDPGQREAALATGLTDGAATRLVVLPQAVRLVVPALVTQLVSLLKDSTLGFVVSYPELMKQGDTLIAYTDLLIQTYIVIAVVYVLVNVALTRLAEAVYRRLSGRAQHRTDGTPAGFPRPTARAVG